jgi:hypothetical protein
MAKRPKGPKAHPTKWTLVFSTKVMCFDTLIEAEAELEKATDCGERAYILPPPANRPQPMKMGASKKTRPMKIEIEYEELLDIVNALKARADVFERMPAPLEPAERERWKREAENHRALADRLLAQADAAMKAKR